MMKEKDFISIIKKTMNSDLIGDDCAYLKDLGIVITQDSLVEDVHFSMKFTTPYELGYKSAMVNISDVVASGAKPEYLTIALSLPKYIENDFVEEFYDGLNDACGDVQIAGGDITGSEKIFISVTAIGSTKDRNISSRKNAKIGQKIVVSGNHGSSGVGLKMLLKENKRIENEFTKAHFMPNAEIEFSKNISTKVDYSYTMMDTSDGLMDALSTIANDSNVLMSVDFDKIPYDKGLEKFENYKNSILYGGEDYKLVAVLDEKDCADKIVIGEVKEGLGVELIENGFSKIFLKEDVEQNLYNHFK